MITYTTIRKSLRGIAAALFTSVAITGVALTSCSDWLDVSPETEKKKSEMFANATGFRTVLTGAYIRMKSTDLYGRELVCGVTEDMALHWNTAANSQGYYLNRFDYRAQTVETAMAAIYNNLYKVVADVNGLLGSIDNGVLSTTDYNLIKGEALALRAFCHFDVLRLFGPMPAEVNAATATDGAATADGATAADGAAEAATDLSAASEKLLPYVTQVVNRPNEFLTYSDFVDHLLSDLAEAETLMKASDPIVSTSISDLNTASKLTDNFWGYRQTRMNYYAVCALKARVLLWIGNKEQALSYARLVVDARDADGNPIFRLGTLNDCTSGDKTLSPEHIFQLKVDDLSATLGAATAFQKTRANLESQLYSAGTTDIRFVNMWDNVFDSYYYEYHNYFVKYQQTASMPALSQNVIPLIRLYEMYLIMLECSPLSEADGLYQTMCAARNTTAEKITTADKLKTLLAKEYNREFYGEGQAFYAYKRLAALRIYFSTTKGGPEVYVVPLPMQEAVYKN